MLPRILQRQTDVVSQLVRSCCARERRVSDHRSYPHMLTGNLQDRGGDPPRQLPQTVTGSRRGGLRHQDEEPTIRPDAVLFQDRCIDGEQRVERHRQSFAGPSTEPPP